MIETLLITLSLLFKAFFAGSETAFVTANKLKLEMASRKKNTSASSIEYFVKKPEAFLATTLVGSIFASILFATFIAGFTISGVQNIAQLWFGLTLNYFEVLMVQIILGTAAIIIFGEILPKAVFRTKADFLVQIVVWPLRIFHFIFRPLIAITTNFSNVLVKKLRPHTGAIENYFQRQDVEQIFRKMGDNGDGEEADDDDSAILQNVIELSNKRVKESMIPRIEINAIEKDTSIKEVLDTFIESGHSKLPVYRDSIDDVIGVVFAHDFFHNPKSLHEIIRPVKLVPSSKKSKTLLTEFRHTNMSVAIVLDEYGGTAGMITIEDLLEEVVGDIQDEYDVDDEIIKKLNPNTFVISGNVVIQELMEEFEEIEIPLEPSQYDTVAGFIINYLGRIPKVNEEVAIDDKKFIISKATPSRIETVKLILEG